MTIQTFAAAAAPRHVPAFISTVFCALLAFVVPSVGHAQNQTWIPTNPNNDWSLTAPNWDAGVPWTNGNNAIFGGTGEIVEIASDVTVGNITFNSNGYTIADANADSIFSLSTGSIITVATASHVATISEGIAAGDITKAGAGILTLSGANTFDGAVSVTAGTLRLGSAGALGSTVGATTISGTATVELQDSITVTGENIAVGSGGVDFFGGLRAAAAATATWAGGITLNTGNRIGALASGVLELTGVIANGTANGVQISAIGPSSATLGTVRISGTSNTYTGTTSIIRGRLQLGADNALPTGTVVDVDSSSAAEDSIFDLNGHTQTIAGLARTNTSGGAGLSFVTNSSTTAATLTLGAGTQTYSGVIQDGAGVVNLAKNGSGTQTLSGSNTYSGTTSVTTGALVFSGSNTLSGAITVTSGSLTMSGANTLGAITVNGGTMTLSGANTINGNISTNATLTLSGANTIAASTSLQVGATGTLALGNDGALGSITAGTVASGGRVVLQSGITSIGAGKTLTLSGNGGNNNGALQTEPGVTATWAGNIVGSGDFRLGGGDNGNLIITGVISGTGSVLYSRATNATTTLNSINTYTGDTQLYASAGTTGARLVIGVDNAINTSSRFAIYASATANFRMTMDLNGKVLTMAAMDTNAGSGQRHSAGDVLYIQNDAVGTTSTYTLSGSSISVEQIYNGKVDDGASGAGGVSLVKNGSFTQTLVAANGYTGSTTINAGTLQLGRTLGTNLGYTGSLGALASPTIVISGIGNQNVANTTAANTGTLALDNLGIGNNGSNRLADTATLSLRGGNFIYRGSEQTGANSSETLGTLEAHSKRSILTVTYGGTNTATLNVGSFTRTALGGLLFVNGANLGLNSDAAASVSRILFNPATPPELIGTTPAVAAGIGIIKTLQIVPGMVGEATSTTGGAGTATGVANTFLTYNATTGLRPLNPTDEFASSFTSDNNVRLTAATTLASSMSVNSLIISSTGTTAYTSTIGSGKTLTVASGNILFTGGQNLIFGQGGTLAFGAREGIITTYSGGNTQITAVITGTAGVSFYGTGQYVTNQQHTYSGGTGLYIASTVPQSSSMGTPGAPTSGPFGTGTLILGGSAIRATSTNAITVHNNVELRADTTMASGGGASTFTFTGAVSLTTGTRTLTNSSDAHTYFSGAISEAAPGSGLTIAGTSARAIVLSGTNTYTGPTTLGSNTTLVINGNQSAATGAVNVNAGTLGGIGTVGGAITIASGATLNPGDIAAASTASSNGTLSSVSSLTLKSGSATNLQITTATFTSADGFGYNEPGSAGYIAYVIANGNTAGSAGTAHDKLIFTSLTQEAGGKITVTSNSFTPVAGQIFNLLDWTDLSTFSSNLGTSSRDGSADSAFDLDLPDISTSGYAWDISLFATHGIIVVTPEPARALLLGIGLAMLGLRRRRSK